MSFVQVLSSVHDPRFMGITLATHVTLALRNSLRPFASQPSWVKNNALEIANDRQRSTPVRITPHRNHEDPDCEKRSRWHRDLLSLFPPSPLSPPMKESATRRAVRDFLPHREKTRNPNLHLSLIPLSQSSPPTRNPVASLIIRSTENAPLPPHPLDRIFHSVFSSFPTSPQIDILIHIPTRRSRYTRLFYTYPYTYRSFLPSRAHPQKSPSGRQGARFTPFFPPQFLPFPSFLFFSHTHFVTAPPSGSVHLFTLPLSPLGSVRLFFHHHPFARSVQPLSISAHFFLPVLP